MTDLNSGQMSDYDKVSGKETVASIRFVQLGDLASIQQDGILELNHPDKGCIARVVAKNVESSSSGDFYWYGEVEGNVDENGNDLCDCHDGYMDIMKKDGKTFGVIHIDDDSYDLEDLGEGRNLLAKKDYSEHNYICGTPNIESEEIVADSVGSVGMRTGGGCPVRVLALYTENANDKVSNIEGKIEHEIKRTNESLRRSLIQECDLELLLVEMKEFAYGDDSGLNGSDEIDAAVEINILLNQTTLLGQNIEAWKNQYEADIVLVFTNSKYEDDVLARAGTLTLQSERSLVIIRAQEMNRSFITSHEIAHIFACRHEPEADPTGPIEHAHKFETKKGTLCKKTRNTTVFSTVEHYTIGSYSNPDVKYKDKKTGVKDEKENWKILRDNACIVAGFIGEEDLVTLDVSWTAPFHVCYCQQIGIGTNVSGGGGGYTYKWYTSTDGFNWGIPLGYGTTFSLMVPSGCPDPLINHIFVKLEVESADGQSVTRTRKIEAVNQIPGDPESCPGPDEPLNDPDIGSRSADSEVGSGQVMNIFPNPASDQFTIELIGYLNQELSIEIYDVNGKRVYFSKHQIKEDIEALTIPINSLINGVYSVKISENGHKKIIKVKNQ